jgi:2',3'-cyclic-nucleotide 2'-phosphodiesterase (5'-nucleotidase family)
MFGKFNRSLFFFFFAIFFITCGSVPAGIDKSTVFRLTMLHSNDLHGRLENVPQYSTIVNHVRSEGGNVLLLDGGDLYRRGPYERFNGAVETEIFNAMKYDAIVFGNNDYPLNDNELYDVSEHTILQKAEFRVLRGNVAIDGEYIKGFEPYIVKKIQGIDVAIIGVTSLKPRDRRFDLTKRALFGDPVQAVNKLVAESRKKSDIQIVLSHAGFDVDKTMRGVSAIVGGDSHTKLSMPYVIEDGKNRIPVVQAGGEQDNYLGRLDLVYRNERGQWVLKEFEGYLFPLKDVTGDIEIQNILDKFKAQLFSQELPTVPRRMYDNHQRSIRRTAEGNRYPLEEAS